LKSSVKHLHIPIYPVTGRHVKEAVCRTESNVTITTPTRIELKKLPSTKFLKKQTTESVSPISIKHF